MIYLIAALILCIVALGINIIAQVMCERSGK